MAYDSDNLRNKDYRYHVDELDAQTSLYDYFHMVPSADNGRNLRVIDKVVICVKAIEVHTDLFSFQDGGLTLECEHGLKLYLDVVDARPLPPQPSQLVYAVSEGQYIHGPRIWTKV